MRSMEQGEKLRIPLTVLVTDYVYDPDTRLIGQQGTGNWVTNTYDAVNNTTLKWNQGSNPMSMTYNAAAQIATMVQGAVYTTYV